MKRKESCVVILHDERQEKHFYTLKNIRSGQANEEARYGIERSIATICEEEGISFEPVLYILFF